MRMYLSSFRMGDRPEHLVAMLPERARVAVVANAMDHQPADERAAGVTREIEALTALGLEPHELDLRAYTGSRPDTERLRTDLGAYDGAWVRGGNVFMLRHALASSGADAVLTELVRADRLVYAGYSAGPCVLAPSLRGLERCDDPDVVQRTAGVPATYDGLGLLDVAFVPHVDSPGHPESELLGEVAARYAADGTPHRVLRDGQALVVRDGTVTLVG